MATAPAWTFVPAPESGTAFEVNPSSEQPRSTAWRYLRALRRSAWVVILCPLLAAAVAAGVSSRLAPVYEAQVSILVRPAQPLGVDPGVAALTSDQITQTYAKLIKQRPLLEKVVSDLKLRVSADALSHQITVTAEPNTTILDVAVRSTNAGLARDVANTLVADFITQIRDIEAQEQTVSNGRSGDNLVVISPAVAPDHPISPDLRYNTLVALAAGLVAALGLVLVRDQLDQTIKSDNELIERCSLVPIGHVGFAPPAKRRRGELIVLDGKSALAEGYRTLRTNLLFSSVDRDMKTVIVTSPLPGEGKSRTAANLAVALAQSGRQTVLVDADFRRPSLHRLLGRVRNVGLSNLMIQDQPEPDLIAAVEGIPNLWFIGSGPTPPNPSELLGSGRMQSVLKHLRERYHHVIVDTPPVNVVTDATVLAAECDGAILVVESGRTTYGSANHARQSLERVGAQVLGAVVNKLRHSSGDYYTDQYSDRYYGPSDGGRVDDAVRPDVAPMGSR